MTNLTIINKNGQLYTDSRDVAEMIGKNHAHLLRDIKGYVEAIDPNPNLDSANFFVQSIYTDSQNQARTCYLLTRKGCDMVANKMTGEKGILFTAVYVTKFEEMEKSIAHNVPKSLPEALRLAADLAERNEMLILDSKKKDQLIGELKPRADYTDKILKNKGLVTITQIAKDYGMSGQALNKLLHDLGVQYKLNGQWLLYREHQSKGYTHSETIDIVRSDGRPDVTMITKWTQKGRLFLYDLLKENCVLPVIEQSA